MISYTLHESHLGNTADNFMLMYRVYATYTLQRAHRAAELYMTLKLSACMHVAMHVLYILLKRPTRVEMCDIS